MRLLLGCACAALMIHAARADEPGNGETCRPATTFAKDVEVAAKSAGGVSLTIDGVRALKFLEYINTKVGEPSSYKADLLIVRLYPGTLETGRALVVLATKGCVNDNWFGLSPQAFLLALKAAEETGRPADGI